MTKKVKILVFPQHHGGAGGIKRYCEELETLFSDKKSNIEIELIRDQVDNHPFWGAKYDVKKLKEIIRNSNCDIVHANGYITLGVAQLIKTAKELGKHVVYTPHWHPFETLRRPFLGKLFFKLILERTLKKYVDETITFNNEDTQFFKKLGLHTNKIPHWMHNSNNVSISPVNKKTNMILFVGGRLNDSNKGIDYLYTIPEGKYDLHFVGRGTIINRSDITLHTNISDNELINLYKQSSLVVVPSRYESFSYVTLEALSVGTPVVISDRVRIGDYLNNCASCGIFKYGDFDDFNRKIETTIGKTVDNNRILKPFLPEVAHELYTNLYTTIIQKRN